jgi:hypothetical protein
MYNDYTNYIASFINSPINEWTFKSHPSYQYVLEHVNPETGYEYLLEIQKKFGYFFNPYSFQGVLYIFKYCMLYRIFETNCSVNLINTIVFLKKYLPTDPSVGTNKG